MIVIKEGIKSNKVMHRRKRCKKCGAEFLYNENDVKWFMGPLIECCYDYVECPTCEEKIEPSIFDRKVEVDMTDMIEGGK